MVGGLQMTNNSLEQYINELPAENDEIKEEMEELKERIGNSRSKPASEIMHQ